MAKKTKKKNRESAEAKGPKPLNQPFAALGKDLKRLAKQEAAAQAPPPPKGQDQGETAAEPVQDDQDRFAAAMAGVQRLPGQQAPQRGAPPPPRLVLAEDDDLEVMARLADLVSGEEEFDLRHHDDYLEAAQEGVGEELLESLRQGLFPIQAHLDLHGFPSLEAQAELEDFIRQSRALGLRHVLVVHGKGKGSPGGVAVLRRAVTEWLQTKRGRKTVLAFCSAQQNDGGTGALYLLLRRWSGPGKW